MAIKEKGYGANIIEDKRRPGKLYVRVYHAGVMYKRRAASLSHARDLVHEIKAAIARGEWPPEPKPKAALFDDLLDEYRKAKERAGKAIMRTDIGYRRLLEVFAGRRADSITAAEVEAWQSELMENMSIASANHHLQLLRAILLRGVTNRRLARGDVPAIKLENPNNKRERYASEDEESRLMAELPESLQLLVCIAIYTGVRKGELLNLRWPDVDFTTGTISVCEAKSGEGRRMPMNSVARAALTRLREQRRERLNARVVHQREAGGFVFAAPEGGFLHDLNRYWYPALKRAGITDLHFHDLRHTFASRYMMAGGDLYSLQTLLGHKTATMTQRYAHLDQKHLKVEIERLAAAGRKRWASPAEGR